MLASSARVEAPCIRTMPKGPEVTELIEELTHLYGTLTVERFGHTMWRVWAKQAHIHYSKAHQGDFVGHGRTLMAALMHLANQGQQNIVVLAPDCQPNCPQYNPDPF